ncbi:Fc.00g039420.m01.CDS01 [Cosmosporella sp. VM-42]
MEPLSISASIVAVLQLSADVARYIVGATGATKQRMRLHEEIHTCESVLFQLQVLLDDEDSEPPRTQAISLLNGPHSPLQRLQLTLDAVKLKLTPKKGLGKALSCLMWPFDEREVYGLVSAIQREKALLQLALTSNSRELIKDLKRSVDENGYRLVVLMQALGNMSNEHQQEFERLNSTLSSLQGSSELVRDGPEWLNSLRADRASEERRAILDWITPTDFVLEQSDCIGRRQPGTCKWFLESEKFKIWLKVEDQTLFCPGIPGAGKTILASVVVDHLCVHLRNEEIGVAYLYFSFTRQDEQTPQNLLACLLRQLTQGRPSIPHHITRIFDAYKASKSFLSLRNTSEALEVVVSLYSKVFIVIDGIDELNASTGYRDAFLAELFAIRAKISSSMSIFATSRALPEIMEKFKDSITSEIRATEQDVNRYVTSHMSVLPSFVRHNARLQEEVKTEIAEYFDGMFLLAILHFGSLVGSRSPKALRATLKQLPTGVRAYDATYRDIMNRIYSQNPEQVELARQVIEWITRAKCTLTISELRHALAVEVDIMEPRIDMDNLPSEDDLVSVCAGLVAVDKKTGVIRLVHYTAQEFFETTRDEWFPAADTELARVCLKYVSFDGLGRPCDTDDEYKERLQSNPLYSYAAKNWGQHASNADISWDLIHSVVKLLEDAGRVEALCQALFSTKPGTYRGTSYPGCSQLFPRKMRGVHLAAYFGLEKIIRLIVATHGIELCDGSGMSALSWAAMRGHLGAVKLLLDSNANADREDQNGMTPLLLAARNGHELVVMALLDKGAYMESMDRNGRTSLSWAAAEGHLGLVRLLLRRGVNVNVGDEQDRAPLLWGARNDVYAVVESLLDAGAQVDREDVDGRTPLSWCVKNLAIEELLLRFGASTETRNRHGRTALSFAASGGHEATAKLLLEHGSNPNATDMDEQTPLLWAAKGGCEGMVILLLENGGIPEEADVYGQTPLSWALQNGHTTLASVLTRHLGSNESPQLSGSQGIGDYYCKFQDDGDEDDSYSAYSHADYIADMEMRGWATSGHIKETSEWIEQIDPRFRVQPGRRFVPGVVFKVPREGSFSNAFSGEGSISSEGKILNHFGRFSVGFQRFLVISNDELYCTSVPIQTYGGKGCEKRGVKQQHHGIIHEVGDPAELRKNEPTLGFPPVRFIHIDDAERLSKWSRVNYSKLVRIPHKVQVLFVGDIVPEDWKVVRHATNKCWEERNKNRRKA